MSDEILKRHLEIVFCCDRMACECCLCKAVEMGDELRGEWEHGLTVETDGSPRGRGGRANVGGDFVKARDLQVNPISVTV